MKVPFKNQTIDHHKYHCASRKCESIWKQKPGDIHGKPLRKERPPFPPHRTIGHTRNCGCGRTLLRGGVPIPQAPRESFEFRFPARGQQHQRCLQRGTLRPLPQMPRQPRALPEYLCMVMARTRKVVRGSLVFGPITCSWNPFL
jgi:hypothetical protein